MMKFIFIKLFFVISIEQKILFYSKKAKLIFNIRDNNNRLNHYW